MAATKSDALRSLKPDAEWSLAGDTLTWLDSNQTAPTESEIAAERTRLDNVYTNEKYKRDRATAYPSIQDQLDMQYWDKKNGTTTWVDAVAKIKSDNPKP